MVPGICKPHLHLSLCVLTAASPQHCGWLGYVDNTLIVFNLILIPIKTLLDNGGVVLLLQKPLLSSQCKMDSKVLRNCSADTVCFESTGSWWELERKSQFFFGMTSWIIWIHSVNLGTPNGQESSEMGSLCGPCLQG